MSLKSIFRALGLARPRSGPQSLGDAVRGVTPQATPFLGRLTSRSDWNNPRTADLWPVTDDPYVDPEPCKVVQDEGLSTIRDYAARTNENTRKLAERGLTGRLENLKIVGDILDLVERQDAAEKKLIKMGYIWNVKLKNWILPLT